MKINIFNKELFKNIDFLNLSKKTVILSEIALFTYLAVHPTLVLGYKESYKSHIKDTKSNWVIERIVENKDYALVDIDLLFSTKYNLNCNNNENTDLNKFVNDIKIYFQNKPYCVLQTVDNNITLYHVDDIINGTHIHPIVTLYYNSETNLMSFITTQYYYENGKRGTTTNEIAYIFDSNGKKTTNITSKSKSADNLMDGVSIRTRETKDDSTIKFDISDSKGHLIYIHLKKENNNLLLHLNFNNQIEQDFKLSKSEYEEIYEILKSTNEPENLAYELNEILEKYVTYLESETTEYRYKMAIESVEILSKSKEDMIESIIK